MKFAFHREASQIVAAGLVVRDAGSLAWRLLCVAETPTESTSVRDEKLTRMIRESFAQSDRTYGSRRVRRDLRDWGYHCGVHRVQRLMRRAELVARPRRRRLPFDLGVRPEALIAPNVLDGQFAAAAANCKWVADFTYLWTAEGWLYVAVVLDLFSRRIVGWSMSKQMTSQLVSDAMLVGLWRRGPVKALLYHSDQSPIHERAVPAAPTRPRRHL
jgi:putative transposase